MSDMIRIFIDGKYWATVDREQFEADWKAAEPVRQMLAQEAERAAQRLGLR